MPVYEVQAPDGRTFEIEGASMPTADQLQAIFGQMKSPEGKGEPSLAARFGQTFAGNMQVPVDVAKGATAGLMRTAYGGGDIIRRTLGMERVKDTPEAQAAMTPPESTAGQVGYYGEQMGEFLAPAARVSTAVKGTRLLTRMAAEGAVGAGIAGVQNAGDPTSMASAGVSGAALTAVLPPVGRAMVGAGRMMQRAAAGAQEGGIGGAVSAAIRTVAPPAPKAMMTQALKPRSVNTQFTSSLDTSLPELKAVEPSLGKPIEGVDDLLKAIPLAKQKLRAQFEQMAGPAAARGTTVDLSPVSQAIAGSIPTRTRLLSPEAADAVLNKAAAYGKRFPIQDAEQLLKEVNAELNGFYAQYPTAQRRALASNPAAASMEAEAKALRDAIYKTLDDPGQGAAAREVNRRYGSLLRLEEEAWRRFNVAARQQPESLSEQIGAVRAAGEIVRGGWKLSHGNLTGAADIAAGAAMRSTARYLKEQQTSDALIRRAFKLITDAPGKIDIPPQPAIRGLLNRGPVPMGGAPDPSGVKSTRAPVMDYDANGRPIYSSDPQATSVKPPVIDAEFYTPESPRAPVSDIPDAEFTEIKAKQLGARPSQTSLPVSQSPKQIAPPGESVKDVGPPWSPKGPAAENAAYRKDVAMGRRQERAFILRWLAEDLDEIRFQKGGNTKESHRAASREWRAGDPEHLKHGIGPGAAWTRGTPVYHVFRNAQINSGTYAQKAAQLNKIADELMKPGNAKIHPRYEAIADAYKEAWTGKKFDFSLVSDETLKKTGLQSRKQLKSPTSVPKMVSEGEVPAYGKYFGEEHIFPEESLKDPVVPRPTYRGPTPTRPPQ